MLDKLKPIIRDQVGLPPALVLIGVGLTSHLILNAVMRKPATSATGLIASLVIGSLIEGYEIWAKYRDIGFFAPGNDPVVVILLRHALDVLLVVILPMSFVVYGALMARVS